MDTVKATFCDNTNDNGVQWYLATTKHGYIRAHERTRMNDSKLLRFIQCAHERGIAPNELAEKWQRDSAAGQPRSNVEYKIYNNYFFAFTEDDNRLITMYPLNHYNFRKKRFHGKEEIRNPKAYRRLYGFLSESDYDPMYDLHN